MTEPNLFSEPTLAQKLARPIDAPVSLLSRVSARSQLAFPTGQAATPRDPNNIGANFLADWDDLLDGYKAIGTALVEHGPGVLVDVIKNMPAAVAQSYYRWYEAAKGGTFTDAIKQHPLEFVQDVAAPLSIAFSGGAAAAARFGSATSKVGVILARATQISDAVQIASEPISGLGLVGLRRGLGAVWNRALAARPEPPRAGTLGVDPLIDAVRGLPPSRPDFPVLEVIAEQELKRLGVPVVASRPVAAAADLPLEHTQRLERVLMGEGGSPAAPPVPQFPRIVNPGEQRELVERMAKEFKGYFDLKRRTPAERQAARAEMLGLPEDVIRGEIFNKARGTPFSAEVAASMMTMSPSLTSASIMEAPFTRRA